MPAVLTDQLQTKLGQLAARDRRRRWMRGCCRVAAAIAVAVGLALALDAWLVLTSIARWVLLFGVVAAGGIAAWHWLITPLRTAISPASLAAAVEAQFPRLDERLSSSVELAEAGNNAFGSPALIDLLIRETDSRTRAIDFERAAPPRIPRWALGFLGLIVFAAIVIGVLWPDWMMGLGRRFVRPWDNRLAIEPFAIIVSSSGDAVAQGRGWQVRAELAPRQPGVVLPEHCTLTVVPDGGSATRYRMHAESNGTHSFSLDNVEGSFRFQVSAGPIVTEEFAVVAVAAPALSSARIEIVSPAYTKSNPQTIDGIVDLTATQFSRVRWSCRFDRPAVGAEFLWSEGGQERRTLMTLADDRQSAVLERTADVTKTYRIVLLADHGVTTDSPTATLKVISDRPPEFRQVLGLGESLREISVNDAIRVQLAIEDDFGLSAADIEYRVNDGPIQTQPLSVTGLGSREARGTFVFPLAGKAQVGDQFHCRLRATDNRSIPDLNLGSQVAYFPSEGQWCDWQIVEQAAPIRERETTAVRDAIDKTIRDLVGQLDRDRQAMSDLSREMSEHGQSTDKEKSKLQELQAGNDQARKELEKLARQADAHDLPTIGDAARSIANRELAQAGEFLKDAASGESDRKKAAQQSEKATEQARDRLERLRADNQRLAQQRLDAEQIENLADKQKQLAEQTNTEKPDEKEQIKKDQDGLAKDLDKLTKENEFAKQAMQAANAEEAQRLSDQAKALAKAERDLDQTIRDAERSQNAAQLGEASKKQKELADQIDRLSKQLQRALAAAQAPPPSSDEAAQAAERLRRGDAEDAREQQRKTADALDQLADRLQSALDAGRDPQQAARQLSRLQADTRRRTLDAGRPDSPERDRLRDDERALLQAIEQLPVADTAIDARRDQIDAAGKARQAITALDNGHMNTAADLMQQAREALDRLANSLPSIADRKKAAQSALDGIRKSQTKLQKKADEAVGRSATKRPTAEEAAALAKQQAEIAELIAQIDPPIAAEKRDTVRTAAGDALDDLMAGRWQDVAASQAELNRQLRQLDEALKGKPTLADRVRDLARREQELANTAANNSGQSRRIAALLPNQERIDREFAELEIVEEAVRKAECASAIADATVALSWPSDPKTPKALAVAAKKLDDLAAQLSKPETPAERAARLARRQADLAQTPPTDDTSRRRQQKQILDEAKSIRAGDQAASEKRRALDALNQLQDIESNPPDSSAARETAADALQRLSERLAASGDAGPTPAELAQQQRDLAAATAAVPKQNGQARADALDQDAQQQRKLREQVNRLPSGTTPQSIQQARLAMAQAEQELRRGDSDRAKQQQLKAAALLDAAARDAARRAGAKNDSAVGLPSAEQIQQARELANQQRQLEQEVKSSTAKNQSPAGASQRQDEIAAQTEELIKLLQQDVSVPAADAARQAKEAMQSASEQQPSDATEARKSRQRAAAELDRAADEAARKSQSETKGSSPGAPPASGGKALIKARGRMQAAQKSLDQDKSDSAGKEMREAAQSLQQAAQELRGGGAGQKADGGSSQTGADPNAGGPQGKQSLPLSADLANELKLHAGKRWGDLPGELRTRIMQDVKAQYGDDYARIIRLYFESLADRK